MATKVRDIHGKFLPNRYDWFDISGTNLQVLDQSYDSANFWYSIWVQIPIEVDWVRVKKWLR
jgi:hypothetical protein